jgi:hypothetical protein
MTHEVDEPLSDGALDLEWDDDFSVAPNRQQDGAAIKDEGSPDDNAASILQHSTMDLREMESVYRMHCLHPQELDASSSGVGCDLEAFPPSHGSYGSNCQKKSFKFHSKISTASESVL